MPLPSSGEIKLSQIRDEFGLAAGQIAMSSLYGKGNAAASGQIQMAANFHGTAGSLIAGSITRGSVEDKSGKWVVGRHESTPNSNSNIGSISYSTSETFGTRFYYDASSTTNLVIVQPNNATAFTKLDKINIGGRTYTRRRSLVGASSFSSVGEMLFTSNYQSNYVANPQNIGAARSSSPFTSSSAMSFTGEEDRTFFCDTSFTSGYRGTATDQNAKLNTSQRRDFRGFQTSTNNARADNFTFGTQSSITLTNPDFTAATLPMHGFYVRRRRAYSNSTFSGAATTTYSLYIQFPTGTFTMPHPSNAGNVSYSAYPIQWMRACGLKRFEVTVGGTTQYYNFGTQRSSLLGGTYANAGIEASNTNDIWEYKNSSNNTLNVGASLWNFIGSGNTVNIKLY
jgi:hypothetical protein